MKLREFLKLWVSGQAQRASEIIYYEPFATPERLEYWKKRFFDERKEYTACRAKLAEVEKQNEYLNRVIQARGHTTTNEGPTGKMIVRVTKKDEDVAIIQNESGTVWYEVPYTQVAAVLAERPFAYFFVEKVTNYGIELGKPAPEWG